MKSKRYSEHDKSLCNLCLFIILLSCVLIFLSVRELFPQSLDTKNCSSIMTSTCSKFNTTNWNSKHVGQRLKEWIKSVRFKIKLNDYKMEKETQKCKHFFISKNIFFHVYGPDAISDKVMLFGNILKYSRTHSMEKVMFDGPVWADLNNPDGWDIKEHPKGVINIRKRPNLRNGLYYGALNNVQMKLGNI